MRASIPAMWDGTRRSVDRPALGSLYHADITPHGAGISSLWMTADNRLSLQQPAGRVAFE
jgi:hypothetical protein